MSNLRHRRAMLTLVLILAALSPVTPAEALAATAAHPAAGGTSISTGAVVIAVIAALVAIACLAWALARRRAFEPRWLLSLRHTVAEAGFRTSETWAEFADWLKLGH
jgi:hypothetical protein